MCASAYNYMFLFVYYQSLSDYINFLFPIDLGPNFGIIGILLYFTYIVYQINIVL